MLNFASSRLKLSKKLEKKNANDKRRNPMKTMIDLPMSTEMLSILENTINTLDDGTYLTDYVSSALIQPLDTMSIFCPTAALIESKYSAIRIPSPTRTTIASSSVTALSATEAIVPPSVSSLSQLLSPSSISGITKANKSLNPLNRNNNHVNNDDDYDNHPNYNEYSVYDDIHGSNIRFNNGELSITDDNINYDNNYDNKSPKVNNNNRLNNINNQQLQRQQHRNDVNSPISMNAMIIDNNNNINNIILNKTTKSDSQIRMDVLWLRKRAEISKEDGEINSSLEYLQQAIDLQLETRDYSKAQLSQYIISNDPKELLLSIQSNLLLYDQTTHSIVGKIQRWYHKWYIFKSNMSILITKIFRGYQKRKNMKKIKHLRKQCALLIQKRFRIHLHHINKLITKIKQWYRNRKYIKEYQKKLLIYKMARRIQRLFRGYVGRKIANLKKLRLISIKKIQNNVRGYFIRRDHHYIISLYHQYYHNKILKIQQIIRRRQAIYKTSMKLISELTRESLRTKHESLLVDETLRIQKIKNYYYFHSKPGQIHISDIKRKNQIKSEIISRNLSSSSKSSSTSLNEDKAIREILDILEPYDNDGNGKFHVKYLYKILSKCLIPISNPEQYIYIRRKLNINDENDNNNNMISFLDFLEWYSSEDADQFIQPNNIYDNLILLKLEVRKILIKINIQHYFNRHYKLFNSEYSEWLIKDTISSFRLLYPPKYECCQCRTSFVLFTDYYHHYQNNDNNEISSGRNNNYKSSSSKSSSDRSANNNKMKGICPVNQQRGLFYYQYWFQNDWKKQKQIEYEIKRINDEYAFINYKNKIQCYRKYYSVEKRTDIVNYQRILYKKSFALHQENLLLGNPKEIINNTKLIIKNLISLTICSNQNKKLSIMVIDCLIKNLYLPMNKNWILNDYCSDLEFFEWMDKYMIHPQQQQDQQQQLQGEKSSISTTNENNSNKGSLNKIKSNGQNISNSSGKNKGNVTVNNNKNSKNNKNNNSNKSSSANNKHSDSNNKITTTTNNNNNSNNTNNNNNNTSNSININNLHHNHNNDVAATHTSFLVSTLRLPTFTTFGLIKQKAYDLSRTHVKFLRLSQIEIESSLFSLLEYRNRRPRK